MSIRSQLHHVIPETSASGTIQQLETQGTPPSLDRQNSLSSSEEELRRRIWELEQLLQQVREINAGYADACEDIWVELSRQDSQCPALLLASTTVSNVQVPVRTSTTSSLSFHSVGQDASASDNYYLPLGPIEELLAETRRLLEKLLHTEEAERFEIIEQFRLQWNSRTEEFCRISPILWAEFQIIFEHSGVTLISNTNLST